MNNQYPIISCIMKRNTRKIIWPTNNVNQEKNNKIKKRKGEKNKKKKEEKRVKGHFRWHLVIFYLLRKKWTNYFSNFRNCGPLLCLHYCELWLVASCLSNQIATSRKWLLFLSLTSQTPINIITEGFIIYIGAIRC